MTGGAGFVTLMETQQEVPRFFVLHYYSVSKQKKEELAWTINKNIEELA